MDRFVDTIHVVGQSQIREQFMKITIVGTGYVGLVTGACFAETGNQVTCVDIDQEKLERLEQGVVPIYEPGLEPMIKRNVAEGRLRFSSKLDGSLNDSRVVVIAVGTPSMEDGSADVQYVLSVAREIGEKLQQPIVVVGKSTVPVGTADKVRDEIKRKLDARATEISFQVVSNPEFLKEGAAVADFLNPDRIVIGADSEESMAVMRELYSPSSRNHDKLQFMGIRDAEMTKYAANALLATKISFMNEIAEMCEHFNVDVEKVRRGIGSDTRIGYSFIYPGAGYGGSCFPKDIRALISMAESAAVDAPIFAAVDRRNNRQKSALVRKILARFGEDLSEMTFCIWGLAFKPGTDDVREAPSLVTTKALIERGAKVHAYDPEAIKTFQVALADEVGKTEDVSYFSSAVRALGGADALIVLTEWKEFWQPDFNMIAKMLRYRVIFDGRNIYEPDTLAEYGIDYFAIGRGSSLRR